jgi:hypothetical protein
MATLTMVESTMMSETARLMTTRLSHVVREEVMMVASRLLVSQLIESTASLPIGSEALS